MRVNQTMRLLIAAALLIIGSVAVQATLIGDTVTVRHIFDAPILSSTFNYVVQVSASNEHTYVATYTMGIRG